MTCRSFSHCRAAVLNDSDMCSHRPAHRSQDRRKGASDALTDASLIEHDAVTELFNATVAMADKRGLLSGEHFSVDGTLIQAWASRKSMRRKEGSDDARPPEDWRGEPRSNDTHQSITDPESRLYRKSNAAPALPSYLGHVLSDNRHGLVVNVQASASHGTAERDVAAQMLADVAKPGKRVTVGAVGGND